MSKKTRSIGTCYNSRAILTNLVPIRTKAELLYSKGGYLHWYKRFCHGNLNENFEESFETINVIIDSYKNISNFA